jgi:hypothetical protein
MRNGRQVSIQQMTDDHLLNTIRVLRNASPVGTIVKTAHVRRRQWLNVMANEAYDRGLSLDPVNDKDPVHE